MMTKTYTPTRRDKLKIFFEKDAFEHNVFTPFELCAEIISQVDVTDRDILVMNPEFALVLIEEFGVNPSRITIFADVDPIIETIARRMGINYIDAWNYNMKFDVVFANPPYQHPTNGRWKLWIQFMERSFDIVSEGGHVSFICPTSWIHCTEHQRELYKAKELLSSKNLISISDVDDSVFNVGEKIGYFVAQNVEGDSSEMIYDMTTIGGKIINRIIGNNYQFTTRLTTLQDKVETSDITCYHSAANNFPIADSDKHQNQRCPKIIMNVSGNYAVTAFGPDVISGRHGRAILFDTMEEAQLAAETLSMRLFKFSVCETKTGGFNNEAMLPQVDLSRQWTDDELYAHFDLTQEEIEYVEANV